MKPIKKSTILPIALLLYLAARAYVGRSYFFAGEYLFYFGVIGATLLIIIILHFVLKKKEKLQEKRKNDQENNKG